MIEFAGFLMAFLLVLSMYFAGFGMGLKRREIEIKRQQAELENSRKLTELWIRKFYTQKAKLEALQMDKEQLETDIANERMNLEHLQAEIESLKRKLNHSIGVDNTKENGYFPFD